ncbi:adhesin domain containing protein [Peptoniphilus obesi]|uniref:adhesin domain containing protein n=1 Tax=Peptoniphilus obesi TaxID=1472765 RepID=UPI0004B945A5|nr:adhesin domain containing protein [Peptoniphilus obesi]
MEKFEKVIEEKKIKSASRVPKYGMRKLSVGLVSCALGFSILGIADPVQAQEAGPTDTTQVQEQEAEIKNPTQAAETSNGQEAIETNTEEKNQVEDKVQAVEAKSAQFEDETQVEDEVQSVQEESDVAQAEENLEIEEEKTPQAQKAGETAAAGDSNLQKADDPNYSIDEKQIEDYSKSERYKETDLKPGDTNQEFYITDEKEEKDGFKFELNNPSVTSPSKTEYGYQITIDKKTGQRTYTKLSVTDSGLIPVNPGEKPMMGQGDKLTPGSPEVTYKPDENTNISASRTQRNLNYEASEETLKHINNSGNDSTSFGMQDNYTQENPKIKFFGDSFALGYKVNPWPNENDKLEELKLNGEYNDKVFVQGQEIDTGIKVDNIDESAKERLVGQVYNPTTGKIVPGARAFIDENGKVKIQMPEGALKKDASGKYVVNEDSIFSKDPEYKGLTYLDVKFFARPRTAEEFKTIAETPDQFGETGTYVETGAGTADIDHKGSTVTIDKQGIDRYDHYNLIGKFNLQLDDTRYYDQVFKDQEGNKIDEHSSTKVIPGQDFSVEIQTPDETGGSQKTGAEMDGAYSRGEATGKLKEEFLDIANKQIADDLGVDYKEFITSDEYADRRWTVDGKSDNISKFTIKAPKQAKAGDFLALPVEYTYTNGSTDTHWFHFVVQETNNNRPEYLAEVGPQGNTLVNNPIVPKKEEDLKKNQPESYELIGNTFKDNKGNVWNVSIDQKTGAVTATLPTNLPEGKEINGGEKLTVPVRVNYTDQTTGEKKTEEIKAQFIATKQHKTLTNETKTSEIPFETKVEYDESLPVGYFQETQAGQKGELKITFVQDTLNGKKGIFQQDGTFKEGESKIVVETVKKATPRIIKIGTKPATTKVEIPFDTEYEVDNNLEAGKTELINDGEKGEVTITTKRNADGTVTINKETTKEAVNKKVKIGGKTSGSEVVKEEIPFEVEVRKDPTLKKGEWAYAKDEDGNELKGVVGEQERTLTIENSKVTNISDPRVTKEAQKAVILIGEDTNNGDYDVVEKKELPYETRIEYDQNLEAGQRIETGGESGEQERTNNLVIKDGEVTEVKKGEFKTTKKPVDKVIKIGIKPIEKETELPFETEYVYDENMEAGKTEVTQEGKEGKAKITTSFNQEKGKLEIKVEREEPTKKIVKYGSKTEGEVKVEYEEKYEVEIIYDSEMNAGEKEVVQEGKNGKSETTITIKNSKEVSRETKVIEKAQKKIIKVGTKNVCEIPTPDPEEPEKPVDPEEPETPETPDNTEKPDTPEKPEKPEEPGKPNIPEIPGKPEEPGKPNIPEIPGKPGEEKPSDPTTPGQTPDKSESKDSEKVENTDSKSEVDSKIVEAEKEKDSQTKEEVSIEEKTSQKVEKDTVKKVSSTDDSRAPQTFDPGVASYLGLGGMTSTMLAYLEYKRRKNKKNK